MTFLEKIFHRTATVPPPPPAASKIDFIIMQGNDFTELSTYDTVTGTCATCGKDAAVITANIADVRRLAIGSVHYPAKLGTKGWKQIPDKSLKLAAYCEGCRGYFHLNCVELLTMGGGTLFRCPKCMRDLGPAPKSLTIPKPATKSTEEYIKEGIEYSKVNKYDDAVKSFQQALQIDPNSAWARWQLGAAYKTQDRLDEAIQEFEEVLRRGAGSFREPAEHWLNEARMLKTAHDKPIAEIESQIGTYVRQMGERGEQSHLAFAALKRVGSPAVSPLLNVIQSNNSLLRSNAVYLLGEIGDKKAFEPLQRAMAISKEEFSKFSGILLNASDFEDEWNYYKDTAQASAEKIKGRG